MSLILSVFVVCICTIIIVEPLKKAPWLFFVLAILASVGAIYFTYNPPSSQLLRTIVFAFQKAHVAFGFFVVVMFIGVFDRDSKVRRYLSPVRAELSIIAALLTIGHFTIYLSNYLSYAMRIFSLKPSILMSLGISFILLLLLIPLTITSFKAVRKRMNAASWKKLQRWAYVFFGLIYFHLLGYLLVPALAGSDYALLNLALYVVLFLLYLILRIRRALLDKRAGNSQEVKGGVGA